MQYKNNGFFALMDLDDDGRLRNVFWADPRSRATYTYFGDVVTFDTTYLTNRYRMPFAPFVVVNHHRQSILLGAGLISSEDTETFTWLFQTWLKCMDSIAPKAIITDQDRTMKNAIALVFLKTQHRFCLWHILKKVPEKLGSHGAYKNGLKNELIKCVYDTQSIEEFENCWEGLINTYSLHENAWLQSLYAEHGHWVPVFLKEFFWAGMSTTQRSESMNAFFDGYVHAKTNLKEFIDQFDNALRKKIENETSADFHSFSATISCISRSPIEKKFQELYTNTKFKEVQQQVMSVLDMDPALYKRDGSIKTYIVEDEICVEEFAKPVTFSVEFNEENCDAKCSCSNPLVVRGKGRPPSLRRASTLEKRVLKVKAKKQKTPIKGKSKQLSREETPVLDTRRNLFGTSETPISTDRHVSQDQVVADSTRAFDITRTQPYVTWNESQETVNILDVMTRF
ncbi:protein FAR1-RELATED SEQUENCE 5-like [Carya illinoinensis]|uniref:protein FAR1-RELATED SEQUENCE 5-like n=1 Tax=Carya illinoinensis TaxID=32201 RepID=UPI001C721B4A|nr:protein FAR1-RELATED SEQUENCE 5-like [Carya illinoinensis]